MKTELRPPLARARRADCLRLGRALWFATARYYDAAAGLSQAVFQKFVALLEMIDLVIRMVS
jgi:hypothetical protein